MELCATILHRYINPIGKEARIFQVTDGVREWAVYEPACFAPMTAMWEICQRTCRGGRSFMESLPEGPLAQEIISACERLEGQRPS